MILYNFIIFIVSIFLALLVLYFIDKIEFKSERTSSNKDNKSHHKIFGSNVLVSAGSKMFFSDQTFYKIANVPLDKFNSTIKSYQGEGDKFYPFFVYNTDYLTDTIDQGECGACWAFSICNTLSDKISLFTGGKTKKLLSVQQILSCFKDAKKGCDGYSPEKLVIWLNKQKIKLKSNDDIPYSQESNLIIDYTCVPSIIGVGIQYDSIFSLTEWIEEINPDRKKLQNNINRMKHELNTNGPFYCVMTVYKDLYDYNGLSVYKHIKTTTPVGGHAIEIIGYCNSGVNNNKEGYWICKNTWGQRWPISSKVKNYFAILMGENECGIESRCGSLNPDYYTPNLDKKLFYTGIEDFKKDKQIGNILLP